jgi:sigma-E factor negative regulatory protein RseB
MRLLLLCCVAALFLGPAPAAADATTEWLLRINDAARTGSYQGVVVFRDGQHMDVMRLVHRHRDGRVQERLTSLTGKPRDILREDDRVYYLVGDDPVRSAAPQGLFPVLSQDGLTEAALHYEYRDLGHSRVAGRPCRGVMLTPRDDYRYGYEICGDLQTAVPLRVTLLDRLGRTIEQLMFTEVMVAAQIPDAAFAAPPGVTPTPVVAGSAPLAPAAPAAASPQPGAWRLVQLPPGFRVVRREFAPSPDGQGVIEHVLLSDGLSAVSVFGVRPRVADRPFNGVSHMGAMSAYSRRVGPYQLTVVGEVPVSTVRMIGEGLAPPDDEPPAAATAETPDPPGSLTP